MKFRKAPFIVGSLRRLRELAQRRKAEGNSTHVYKYLQGGNEDKVATHSPAVPSDKTRSVYL